MTTTLALGEENSSHSRLCNAQKEARVVFFLLASVLVFVRLCAGERTRHIPGYRQELADYFIVAVIWWKRQIFHVFFKHREDTKGIGDSSSTRKVVPKIFFFLLPVLFCLFLSGCT